MKKAAIIISLVFISILGYTQSCLPNGITFTTQEQIDSFQTDYPNCTQIEGHVTIGNYPEGTSITNLDGLSNITQIDGSLDIHFNLLLSSLNGLLNLTQIGGGLTIFYNPELYSLEGLNSLNIVSEDVKLGIWELNVGNDHFQDLTGLDSLYHIGGSLLLFRNIDLESLAGLENLSYIGESLIIDGNHNLTDISSLEGLSNTGYGLGIQNNYNLTNLYGLHNIDSLNGPLIITGNASITTLIELENLTSAEQYLRIVSNQNLININGLENLVSVDGEIDIHSNNVLNDISGIKNINAESISNLKIYHNDSLSTCHIKSVCNYLEFSDAIIDIQDNFTGCNSPEDVEENCETIGIMEHINSISISPNPATDFVQFSFDKNESILIQIYNTNGELIEELNGNSTIFWNCKWNMSGIYFYKAISNDGIHSGKVILL